MRIYKIKVFELKDEYRTSIKGQNELLNIINDAIKPEKVVEYKEGEITTADIVVEASYYLKEELMKEKFLHDLFLGSQPFKYRYTRWEVGLNKENPSDEEIKKFILSSWYYPISPDDTEEIEEIKSCQEYAFEDGTKLFYVPADRVEEMIKNFDEVKIFNDTRRLEEQLNNEGISFDRDDKADLEAISKLKDLYVKAREEHIGLIYVLYCI